MKQVMEGVDRLPEGDQLEVLVDHPPAVDMIRPLATRRGFLMEAEPAGSGEWRIRLRRPVSREVKP